MEYPKEMASKLNELLVQIFDSEKAFRNAADDVEHSKLKAFFKEVAQQRYDLGHELRSEIRNFGEAPEESSSIGADARRTWMNVRSALTTNKEKAVLEEVQRGEAAALKDYNRIIKETNFPPSTENMLRKQRKFVQQTLHDSQSLENLFT